MSRCSERSQPKTRSFKIPDFLSFPLAGRERIKLLKKVINFPCFLKTGFAGVFALPPDDPVGEDSSSSASSESVCCCDEELEPDFETIAESNDDHRITRYNLF